MAMTFLTDAEAKMKWCPMARAGDERSDVRIPVNRNGNAPDQDCYCITSTCMAWRWEAYRKPDDRDGEKRGYCGAFGIPMESIV
jgi:hypothetical protein